MEQVKNLETDDIHNQISIIKDTVKSIIKNAKYGSYENLLRDLSKIETASSKIHSRVDGSQILVHKYKRILVPYDGSRFSKNALNESLEMAKAFGSKIFILTVIEVASDIPPGVLNDVVNKRLNKLKREISMPQHFRIGTKLQQQLNESRKEGIDVEVEVLIGRAADSILKFANQNKVELIAIGSRGLRGMGKLMALGSVSRRVSEESKCPVLIVR